VQEVQSKLDWHLTTQNKDYLDLSIKRLNEPALIWVSQFTDIINSKIKSFDKPILRINDIGCNVGHFYRNVNEIKSKVNYTGFDISQTYLDIAHNHFPEANFILEDVGSSKFDKTKYNCDISIISATLEHIEDFEVFLENVFESTNDLVLIRTFIGNESRKDYCLKPGATQSYLIRQFQLAELKHKSFNSSWNCEEIEDLATGGVQKQVCDGINRSQRILSFQKVI
jgi:2-polyprenyl-3-methyl-5-hydroxy-6-metoxy-1,4-benzoquinol methylase